MDKASALLNSDVTIMVVDDDAMVRSIVIEHLQSFGFTSIIEVPSGEAALRMIRDPSVKIDLILSDWEMPGVDGYSVLQAVRKDPRRSTVGFIMITSQTPHEKQKIHWAKRWRVDSYIVKPFVGETLRAKIFEVMGCAPDKKSG